MKLNLIANLNGALIGLSFGAEREITLGREIGNTISPLTAEGLSRHHAKLYFKDGDWYVEDLGSMNGTYLMGQKIEAPMKLAVKNVLQFGSFKLTVDEFVAAEAASATAPSAPPPVSSPLMTPAEAAQAGAAAELGASATTAPRRPTVPIKPGSRPVPAGLQQSTTPTAAPAAAVAPIEDLPPVEPLEPLPPVEELKPVVDLKPVSPAAPAAPAAKPVVRKPGIKLPTAGTLKPGLKLPTAKPAFKSGLKLPTKPSLKLPPKS
ncbi:MAG: FHA domain-containing protein [Kiritimatiellia bacterium]